jgi:hypothetical protein
MTINVQNLTYERVAYCKKCGSKMWVSHNDSWGPMCNNKLCDGCMIDAEYVKDISYYRRKKLKQLLTHYGESINNNKSV